MYELEVSIFYPADVDGLVYTYRRKDRYFGMEDDREGGFDRMNCPLVVDSNYICRDLER